MQTREPVQLQISKSFPNARGEWNLGPPAIQPGVNKPFEFGSAFPKPTFIFIDAPNVSHSWNVKNASLVIRNATLFFSQSVNQLTEWEYSIEYQLRSAGVPLLIAIERRRFAAPGSEIFQEELGEIIVNYEAVRSQYVVPGSGLELAIYIRNVEKVKGASLSPGITILLENNELNLNVERTPR